MKNIYVTQSLLPSMKEYIEEIRSIWDTKLLTNCGPKHQQLEKKLNEYMKTENCCLFANGHLALETALRGLKLKGEVITTPFTYASTTQAIVNCGLIPVFCDINDEDYCIDTTKIEELITEKTSAILPVHVYGNICDYKKIDEIAQKHNLKVIYDAAHAFGEMIDGISVGTFGDVSMFSFHATKVFNTVEGGCLTFAEDKLYKEFSAIRQFGMYGKEDAEVYGINAKMSEFHAAMGLCNLRHLDDAINLRKKIADIYRKNFDNIKGINICKEKEEIKYNYAYFPVVFDRHVLGVDRDFICQKLSDENIYARKYFYPLTSSFSVYEYKYRGKTPLAEEISKNVLTLPIYPDLSVQEAEKICEIVLKAVRK